MSQFTYLLEDSDVNCISKGLVELLDEEAQVVEVDTLVNNKVTVVKNTDEHSSLDAVLIDISEPVQKFRFTLKLTTLGQVSSFKTYSVEVCGLEVMTDPLEMVIPIDGSKTDLIRLSLIQSRFLNPSMSCRIFKYEFLEVTKEVEPEELLALSFDFNDPKNFILNTDPVFNIKTDTIEEDIEVKLMDQRFLVMQFGEKIEFKRFVRATTIGNH